MVYIVTLWLSRAEWTMQYWWSFSASMDIIIEPQNPMLWPGSSLSGEKYDGRDHEGSKTLALQIVDVVGRQIKKLQMCMQFFSNRNIPPEGLHQGM